MVSCGHDIEEGIEDCGHAGRNEDAACSSFKRRNLTRDRVVGRVGKTRIEIPGRLKVEELAHFLAGFIPERRTRNNRQLTGFAALRTSATLNANGFQSHVGYSP